MEKGVTYPDLDIFVSVGLGNSNESIIEGWSVRKSKHNRFVITPTGYLLNIFTMLPLLAFGIPLTFFGIVLYEIMPGIIGILLLLLCLLIRRSELCIDLNKGYVSGDMLIGLGLEAGSTSYLNLLISKLRQLVILAVILAITLRL